MLGCQSCAGLPSTEHQRQIKSLQQTLNGLLTDKDIALDIAFKVISPEQAIITLDGKEVERFSVRESPWEIRERVEFVEAHYLIPGGIEFQEAGR
jgi:hypothetical protein